MNKSKILASVLVCLMFAFSVFADGDTPTTGRSCDPQTECTSEDGTNSYVNPILELFSQIVDAVTGS